MVVASYLNGNGSAIFSLIIQFEIFNGAFPETSLNFGSVALTIAL